MKTSTPSASRQNSLQSSPKSPYLYGQDLEDLVHFDRGQGSPETKGSSSFEGEELKLQPTPAWLPEQPELYKKKSMEYCTDSPALARMFAALDRSHSGRIGMQEILRALGQSLPAMSSEDQDQYRVFLEEAIPAYSSRGTMDWSVSDLQRFLEDCLLLEKMTRRE